MVAAALSVAALDFFFVEPFYTFAVSDARHLLTFAMMFVVSVLLSGLMLRIRKQERATWERAERTTMLYALTRAIGAASSAEDIARVVIRHVEATLECDAAVWLASGDPSRLRRRRIAGRRWRRCPCGRSRRCSARRREPAPRRCARLGRRFRRVDRASRDQGGAGSSAGSLPEPEAMGSVAAAHLQS